jgi:hypothetical protein
LTNEIPLELVIHPPYLPSYQRKKRGGRNKLGRVRRCKDWDTLSLAHAACVQVTCVRGAVVERKSVSQKLVWQYVAF